jgi:hypothetical protein
MNPAQDHSPEATILEARRFLETWERLGRAHMMIGSGCSCGIGGVVVVLEDFEQDIVDYLHAEAERLDRDDVLTLLGEQAREGDQWSISKLLDGLTQSTGPAFNNPSAGAFLVERLGRTLQSFEKLHGSR